MAQDVNLVRSIGIIGQGGVGKTSVADALLFAAGAVNRQGKVDEENSNFDFEPEEQRHRSTLGSGVYTFAWNKHDITLVDTPGYANFLPDTLQCIAACTGVIFVAAPHSGELRVEAEQVWQRASQVGLPVIAFVSRLDRENASVDEAVADLAAVFGARPVLLHFPIGAGHDFRGVVDLLTMKAELIGADGQRSEAPIPAELAGAAASAREHMIEAAAEANDEFTERYLEEGTLTDDEIVAALRIGTRTRAILPVLCGSAASLAGIDRLLGATVEYLGSAADVGPIAGRDPGLREDVQRHPTPEDPFSALVFKTVSDPFSGKLTLLRIVSGRATSDATVLNPSSGEKERLGHLLRLEGKKHTQVDAAIPGEIVGVAKLKATATGDTLCSEAAPVEFPRLNLSPPAISFAIQPKGKGDEDKIAQGLHRLMEEDPALELHRDPQTRELILSGVGQLHIEVAIERLKRKYGAEVELQAPKIPYKETIRSQAEAQGKLKKQTGGRGQYGDAWLRVEPLPRGSGFEFADAVVGGVVPRSYIPAVEKGVREAMAEGVLAGYPVVDIKATLFDGSYHDVDSSEMAFKIAASMGFKQAVEKAGPVLLEPVMSLVINVPDECMGDVIGDLNSRRGKVQSVDAKSNGQVIHALVPMAEVLKYAPDLRSMTSGRGSFTIAFSHYDEVPAHLVGKIVQQTKES